MKTPLFLLMVSLLSCSEKHSFSLLHYNVKEFSEDKMLDPQNKQSKMFFKFLKSKDFDILSINELQYKPTALQVINTKLEDKNLVSETFIKANTGKNSTQNKPDIVNFGISPGQYSNGALMKYKILNKVIVKDLKWKDFYKDEDFSSYALSNGKPIPETIELFDKSFSDTTLMIEEKQVHLILLHTVPSYGFGNSKTINFVRNQRQLEFLKWYINLDGSSKVKSNIKPLDKNSYYIIVGDLNVDYKADAPGSKVLNQILNQTNPWIPKAQMDYTHPNPKLMLDYIIVSKNIRPIEGKIFKNASSEISDHLPIWGRFEIN